MKRFLLIIMLVCLGFTTSFAYVHNDGTTNNTGTMLIRVMMNGHYIGGANPDEWTFYLYFTNMTYAGMPGMGGMFDVSIGNVDKDGNSTPDLLGTAWDSQDEDFFLGVNFADWGGAMEADPMTHSMDVTIANPTLGISQTVHFDAGTWGFSGTVIEDYFEVNIECPECEPPSSGPTIEVMDLAGVCWPTKLDLATAVTSKSPADAVVKFYSDEALTTEVAAPGSVGLASNPTTQQIITYYAQAQSADGSEKSEKKAFKITINPQPEIKLDVPADPVCYNAPVNLTVNKATASSPDLSGITNYRYYNQTTSFDVNSASSTYNIANITAGGIFSVDVTGTGGCKATASATITVTNTDVVAAGNIKLTASGAGDFAVCSGDAITLTASLISGDATGVTFEWGAPIPVADRNAAAVTVSPSTTTTYSVKGKVNGCLAAAPKTQEVKVNTKPTLTITNPAPVCGGTVNLTQAGITAGSTSGLTYTYWTNVNCSTAVANSAAVGAGTYYIKGTNASTTCWTAKPVTATVNTVPTAVIAVTGNVTSGCSGTTVTLTAQPAGMSYSWSNGAITGSITPTLAVGSNSFTLTVTDNNNCSNTTATPVVITGNAAPTVKIDPVAATCAGSDINLNAEVTLASGAVEQTASWTGSTVADASQKATTATLAGGTNKYTFSVTDDKGCTGKDEISVTGNELTVTLSGNNSPSGIASGSSVVLTANAKWNGVATTSGVTYTFEELTPDPKTLAADAGTPHRTTVTPTSTSTYKVTVLKDGCTKESAIYTVKVLADPFIVDEIAGTLAVCEGVVDFSGFTPLTVTAKGGQKNYTYAWSVPAGMTVDATNAATMTITGIDYTQLTPGTHQVSVTVSDASEPQQTVTKTKWFKVNGLPTIKINNMASGTIQACKEVASSLTASIVGSAGGSFTWATPVADADKNKATIALNTTVEGSVSYTVTGVDGNGCVGTATVDVNVNPLPELTLAAKVGDNVVSSVCPNTTITLNASATGITDATKYSWSGGATGLSGMTPTTVPTKTAGTTYIVTVTDEKGCQAKKEVTVAVYTPGTISVNADYELVCAGSSVTLTASGGSDYAWTGQGLLTTTGATQIVTLNTANTYTYTVTGKDEHGCVATPGTKNITVSTAPTLVLAKTSVEACVGTSIDLASAIDKGLSTNGATVIVKTVADVPVIGTSVTTAGNYKISLKLGSCETETKLVAAIFNPLPDVILAVVDNKTSVCSGSQITLNATSTDATTPSFKWEDATTGASKTFTTANAGTTNINVTYKVTADNGKCKKDATTQVTVKALPDVKIANPGQVCTDNAVLLSASGADTYVWNNDASKTGATCNIIPTMSNNVFTVIGHNNTSGCEKQATVTLDVTLAPTMVVNALAPICEGTQVNLANAVIGVYQLEFFDAGKNKLTNGQVSTAGTYYIQGHLVETCKTEMYPVTVTVNPKPAIVIAGTTATCAGGSVTLTASGGSTYAWNTGAKTPAITVTPSSTTTYDVTGTASNGCSAKATQEVTVHPKPVLAWNPANPTTVVEGNSITMITKLTETTAPYIYTWTKPADAASNITSSHTLAQAKTNPEKFEVKVTDGNNCVSELLAGNVEVTPAGGMLKVELSTVTNMLCVDGSQILIAKATGGTPDYSYAWSKDGVAIPGEVGESLTVQDGGTYRVTVSDNGASVQTQFKEKILSASALHAPVVAVADQTIPSGTSTVLFATVTGGDNNNAFTWTPLEKLQSGVTTANPVTTVLTANQPYQVYVQDGQGCLSTPKTLNVSVDNVNGFTVVASANPATVCIGAKSKLDASLLGASLPDAADLEYVWTSSVKSDLAFLSSPTVKSPVFTADAASTKNYFVKVTDVKSGRVAGGQVTVTVSANKKPQLSLPGAGEIACVGDQVTVTVTDASVNDFSWMIDKQPVVLGTATYVLSDAGSHLVEVFAKATNGCASDTVRQNYNLSALPTIAWADGNPASVEKNSDVTIKAIADGGKAGNYTYNWTKPTEKDEATGSYTVTKILAKTSFVVAVTDNTTGCKSSDITHVVSVSAATPDIEFATNVESGLLCQGGISVLDVISVKGGVGREDIFDDYTYAWYKGSELKASTRKYAVSESGIYKIEVKDKNGKLASKNITVTVDSRVAPTVQGSTLTIASGSQAVLYSSVSGGTAPYNYQWEPMDKLVTASTIAGPKTVVLSAAQDYRYYVTDANKCTSQYATVSVDVRESIDPALFSVVALVDKGTICVGNTTRLRAETSRNLVNPTYEWAPAMGLSAANIANPLFTGVTSDVYTYTVKVTENGISATSQVTVTVNPVEAPKLALSDDGVCAGETLTVTNSGASISGAGYKWVIDGVLKTDVTSATYPLEAGTHTVKVYASSLSGCVSDTVTNTYTRKARPVLAWDNTDLQHNPSTATEGNSFTMKVVAQPEQNVTYYWKYMFGGTPVTDYNSTFNDNTVVGAEVGAYDFEVYAMLDGCASTPLLTQTVNVLPKGSVLSVTTDKTTFDVCQSGYAVITATGHNGDKTYTYKWYKGTVATGTPVATGAVAMIQPSVNGEKYVVEVTDGSGAKAVSIPVTLTLNANRAPSVNGANLAVNAGSATVLVSDVFGNTAPYKYFWTPTDKIAAGQTGQANPMTVALSASQGYEYYVTDKNNCVSGKALVQVTVKTAGQIPVIAASASRTDLCLDNTSQLEVKAVSGSLSNATTYKWSPAIYLSATNISNPVFTATVTGAYEYTVKVIDNGNTMTAKVSVTVSGNSAPKIKWDVNNPVSVKNGDAFTMKAVASVGGGTSYKYHWTKPDTHPGEEFGEYVITSATGASYDFEVCAEDNKGCRSEIITKNVPVENASTPLVITVENQKICAVPSGKTVNVGLPVTVTSGHANVTYAWTAQGNSLPLTATTTATAQVDIAGVVAGTYTFNVTASETGNLANTMTKPVTLTIFAAPEAQIDSKCLAFHKDTVFLLNVVNPKDYGYIWGVSMYDMVADKWTPGVGDNTAGSSINGKMVNSDIRYTLTVTDKSELACKAYDTAYVYRIPDAPKVDIDTNTNRLNVKLNWGVPANTDDYTVWGRKWDPYCETMENGGVYALKKTLTGSEWTESKMDTMEFYYVTANRNICGKVYHSLTSDTVGYMKQWVKNQFANGEMTANNIIAYPFDMSSKNIHTMQDLYKYIGLTDVMYLASFNFEDQIWENVIYDVDFGDWVLQPIDLNMKPGGVYMLNIAKDASIMFYGRLPKKFVYDLKLNTNGNTSSNRILLPLSLSSKKLIEVGALIPNLDVIGIWNFDLQISSNAMYDSDFLEWYEEEFVKGKIYRGWMPLEILVNTPLNNWSK